MNLFGFYFLFTFIWYEGMNIIKIIHDSLIAHPIDVA